jgi:hypothetical protein
MAELYGASRYAIAEGSEELTIQLREKGYSEATNTLRSSYIVKGQLSRKSQQ